MVLTELAVIEQYAGSSIVDERFQLAGFQLVPFPISDGLVFVEGVNEGHLVRREHFAPLQPVTEEHTYPLGINRE